MAGLPHISGVREGALVCRAVGNPDVLVVLRSERYLVAKEPLGILVMRRLAISASRMAPNKQLERTVIRRRVRAASAPFHYALAARWTARRAAAQLRR